MVRHSRLTALAGIVAALVATSAFAAKPAPYAPTLTVSFSPVGSTDTTTPLPYATPYTVSGCGYSPANGGVTVVVHSPEAISFAGQLPDANGCIAVTNFSTQGPGHYQLDAWQHVRNKDVVVASTSFDL